MSLIQNNIVYIWLLPVLAQIAFPLFMLLCWLGLELLENLFGHKSSVNESEESLGISFDKAV